LDTTIGKDLNLSHKRIHGSSKDCGREAAMITLNEDFALWLFALLFLIFMVFTVLAAKLLTTSKPTPLKTSTYECGQKPMEEAHSFLIAGSLRYFIYAMAFFALDAFSWILLASARILNMINILLISIYIIITAIGIVYLLTSLERLVR